MRILLVLGLALLSIVRLAPAATPVADGTDLIAGEFVPNRQPDGNSILFHTGAGLVVMDNGRHAAHTQQILDFAHDAGQPVAAVINSHWHLDHIGGNARVRAAYPGVRIYASGALKDALGGFLAGYRKQLEDAIAQTSDEKTRQSYRDEIAIIDAGPQLAPDEVITGARALRIGGRVLELHLEKHSVTAGDVWVFDPVTRVLAAGDLVTLPVPFLDTACPAHWKTALDDLDHANFKQLIPGHGAPMSHAEFGVYRKAFSNFVACGAGKQDKAVCIDGWLRDAASLLAGTDREFVKKLLDYYVDASLRTAPDKTAKLCGA